MKKTVSLLMLVAFGCAALVGCQTGSMTADEFNTLLSDATENFNTLLSGAQELWVTFLAARAEFQAFEAQPDSADKPDELARLEAEAIRVWQAFELLRDMVQGRASTGSQKAAVKADLYQGPMPALR